MPEIEWLIEARKKFEDSITLCTTPWSDKPIPLKVKNVLTYMPEFSFPYTLRALSGEEGVFTSHWRIRRSIPVQLEWKYPFTEGMIISGALGRGPSAYFLHRVSAVQWTIGATAYNTRCWSMQACTHINLFEAAPNFVSDLHQPPKYTKKVPWPLDADVALSKDWAISSSTLYYKHYPIGTVRSSQEVRLNDDRYLIFQEQLSMFGLVLCPK